MKISKLLVLSALWLAAGSAMAAIVDGVRQKPTPQTTAFVAENTVVYLYNVNAKAFFTQGNNWATQASIGDEGRKMRFNAYAAAEGTYTLQQYNWRNASDPGGAFSESWRNVFFDSATALFCDRGSQANYGFAVELGEGNNFLLRAASVESGINPTLNSEEYPNKYVGLDVTDNAANTALSPFLTDSVTHYITWALVTEEDYQNYMTLWNSVKDVFNKAAELKAVIDEAKVKNIDVSAQEAVYLNEEATIEDLEAAIAAVSAAIAAHIEGSVESPTLMTNLVNGNFPGTADGWKGTVPGLKGDGKHAAAEVAEHFNRTFDTYQNLSGMPKGVFRLNAKTFYRGSYGDFTSGVKSHAYMYATANGDTLTTPFNNAWSPMNTESFVDKYGSTTYINTPNVEGKTTDNGVTYYIPDNPSTFRLYYEEEGKNYYDTNLFFSVEEGNVMTVGVKKEVAVSNDWSVFDEFQLYYYGNAAEAYKFWVDEAKKNMKAPATEGVIFTESYLTAYNTAFTAAAATNKAEVLAIFKAINDANDALQKNIDLWKKLQKVIADAIEVAADESLDDNYTGALAEWAEFDTEEILNAHELTNEDLETLITEKKAAIEEARKHPKGTNVDMTALLVNPDFDAKEGATYGWTGFKSAYQIKWGNGKTSFQMPTDGGTATNKCAEAFSTTEFDLYQIVPNAPVGVYEISVQGFCRHGRGDVAWNNYQEQKFYSQPGKFPVWVYLNAKKTPFKGVFEEPVEEGFYKGVDSGSEVYVKDGMEFPDGMKSSAVAFANGMYKQKAIGLVAREGDSLRIGVKGHSEGLDGEDDNWVIFDNFQLTWKGYQADIIKPALEEELTKAQERVNETMGKTAYTHLMTAIGSAQSALQGEDGEVMFNALSALFEVDDEVTASVEAFKDLDSALKLLNEEMGIHTDSPALEDASNLMDEITGNISNHIYTDADVEALIAKINEMIVKLRIPVYNVEDITDLNPVDFTALINNPTYDEGLDGWTYEVSDVQDENEKYKHGGDAGNVQFYGCNYDYYQEISGLPAGIYRVAVTGFFRSGNAAEEWVRKDSVKYSRAFIYAIGENGAMNNKALTRLAENSVESSTVESGYAVAKTDTVDLDSEIFNYTLLASTMATAGDMFYQNLYSPYELTNEGKKVLTGEGNMVTVKVGEDGKLRIGLFKNVATSNLDWTVWDDWTLWYFGPNSALLPSGDNSQYQEEQGIAIVNLDKAIRVETFTLDGRKVTSKQRGIVIQRMTMPDGSSVVIKKIRK